MAAPKQPSYPPPQERAPAPITQPRRYSFSIRSLKPKQPVDNQVLITPGVSLSPDPLASASTNVSAAPPKGAAPGAARKKAVFAAHRYQWRPQGSGNPAPNNRFGQEQDPHVDAEAEATGISGDAHLHLCRKVNRDVAR